MKLILTILAMGVLLSATPQVRAELVNGVMAVVDDSVITYDEVESLTAQTADVVVRQMRSQPTELDRKINEMRNENLQKLMDRQLILHEFKTAGYSLPDSVVDEIVTERVKSRYGDRMHLTKTLEAQGMTYEKFRQQVRDNFIVEQLRLKNISQEIIISPHKVDAYYQAHLKDYKVEDEVKLRVIVLKATDDTNAPSPLKLAQEIWTKVNKEGASFSEMASLYSQGSQRNQGGDWGWWARNELTKGLADIAFSTPKGKCSGVFSRTFGDDYWVVEYDNSAPTLCRHYGVDAVSKKQNVLEERHADATNTMTNLPPAREYYLLQVEDVRPAHTKALSEVRDQIEQNLLAAERARLEQQWIAKLKHKTFVRTGF